MDFAVVLTHQRQDMLDETVAAIAPQVDRVLIIDNASDPPVEQFRYVPNGKVYYVPDQPPNLARLWNFALDKINDANTSIVGRTLAPLADHHDVAFLCDDSPPWPGWFDTVRFTMHEYGCDAASTGQYGAVSSPLVKRQPDGDIYTRMHGAAFILCGKSGIRADERMHWWWLDTDIDWQARHGRGMVIVPGQPVENRLPNHWTVTKPELGEQAGRDREAFRVKHGWVPW